MADRSETVLVFYLVRTLATMPSQHARSPHKETEWLCVIFLTICSKQSRWSCQWDCRRYDNGTACRETESSGVWDV